MYNSTVRAMLMASAFALAGCGGGGGGGLASMPPPPVSPTPAPGEGLIPAATTSQQLAVAGATKTDAAGQAPLLDPSEQMQLRYDASTGTYEAQLPGSTNWGKVSLDESGDGTVPIGCSGCGNATVSLRSTGYEDSRLLTWFDGASYGIEAVGIATPASGVPVTGSATYAGDILGHTSELHAGDTMALGGSIDLSFNFATAELSGSIAPILYVDAAPFSLGTIDFRDTVYSTGSPTFSGSFDTNVPGVNSFSGLFTGPNAEELIGNFALPYRSPVDAQVYHADGAFVAKQ